MPSHEADVGPVSRGLMQDVRAWYTCTPKEALTRVPHVFLFGVRQNRLLLSSGLKNTMKVSLIVKKSLPHIDLQVKMAILSPANCSCSFCN